MGANWIKVVLVWLVVLAIASFFFGETGAKIAGVVFAGFFYLAGGVMLIAIPVAIVYGIMERRSAAKRQPDDSTNPND